MWNLNVWGGSRLSDVVSSAQQWQTSWFRRVFHRWLLPGANRQIIGFLKKLESSIRKRRKNPMNWLRPALASETNKTGFFRRLERSVRKRRKWLFSRLPGHRAAPLCIGYVIPADHSELREWRLAKGKMRVVYISGEPDFPAGHFYRVQMYADTLARHGYSVQILRLDQIGQNRRLIETACVAIVWRAPWSDDLAGAVAALKKNGGKLVFDVDDYMFDPALAKIEVIDGIRSQGFTEKMIADYYRLIQMTMSAAHVCTCPTAPLAAAMRRFDKPVFVLPNGFDDERHQRSRRALAERRAGGSDGLIRIGYAGGTRTHQKDFVCAVPAVARVLREHPECRLVLFFSPAPGNVAFLGTEEFPELKGLDSQIEWRQAVPVRELPGEMARFDINLAPLEVGNLFCEAKSELKYFEAALVEVPTVASPTVPYAGNIRPGVTGFLAVEPKDWYAILKRLVNQPELRARIGRAACRDVLPIYGPERCGELVVGVLAQVRAI
jgi:glycosyltransferase involved in cell wall biosynthesis